jgi:hypothetical protein
MALSNEQWNAPSGVDDFYEHQISQSIKGLPASNISRDHDGAATNGKKVAISFWHKMSNAGTTTGVTGLITAFSSETAIDNFVTETWANQSIVQGYQYSAQNGDGSYGYKFNDAGQMSDPAAWKHIVLILDSTQGTTTNRAKLFLNGRQATTTLLTYGTIPSNYVSNYTKDDSTVNIIRRYSASYANTFDGYLAELAVIDGGGAVSDFGETKNGVWVPKDLSGLTFGNNGFHLDFGNASALGADVSGNSNSFGTLVNIAARQQVLDSPTHGSSSGGNFCTLNSISPTTNSAVYTEGGLKVSPGSNWSSTTYIKGNMHIPKDKKIYFEASDAGSNGGLFAVGIARESGVPSGTNVGGAGSVTLYDDSKYVNGTQTSSFVTQASAGDIIQIAVDGSNGKVWLGINNTWAGSGDPAAGSNQAGIVASFATEELFPVVAQNSASNLVMNFGQDSSFGAAKTAQGNGGDQEDFTYTPPSGFVALSTQNLTVAEEVDPAETNDDFPQKLFSPILYTGTDADINVPVGFKPDWVWLKNRAATYNNYLFDSTRGVTKILRADTNAAEATTAESLKAFISTGFTYGDDATGNEGSATMVSWNWRANGGSLTANDDGNATSNVQTDPSGAFSIVKYTGTASALTIGHGLSVEPKLTLVKDRDAAVDWVAYTKVVDGSLDYFLLNTTAAKGDSGLTGPNSSIWNFQVESGYSNTDNRKYIMYNFANVDGYCKVGSYEGNGNADGAFVYTGFSPAFVIIKSADSTSDWQIFDNKREGYNVDNDALIANDTTVEATADNIDLLSNGFKCRISSDPNVAETYIYLAFAHNPFKYATAR